jgi:CheY-like chemotaxis protein
MISLTAGCRVPEVQRVPGAVPEPTREIDMADILLIDDMNLVRGAIRTVLTRGGHAVTEAANGEAGIALLKSRRFDLVVTDVLMPGCDGNDVVMFLDTLSERPPVLSISGGATGIPADEALRWSRKKADAVMVKPFVNHELLATVRHLLAGRA